MQWFYDMIPGYLVTNANFLARGIQGTFPEWTSNAALHKKKKNEIILREQSERRESIWRLKKWKKNQGPTLSVITFSYRMCSFSFDQRCFNLEWREHVLLNSVTSHYVSPKSSIKCFWDSTRDKVKWHPRNISSTIDEYKLGEIIAARLVNNQKISKHMSRRVVFM